MEIPIDELVILLAIRIKNTVGEYAPAEQLAKWLLESGHVTQEAMFSPGAEEKKYRETGV